MRKLSVSRSNIADALQRPKSMTLNCNSPCLMEEAVLGRASVASATCQYPLERCRELNQLEPVMCSNASSIRGIG